MGYLGLNTHVQDPVNVAPKADFTYIANGLVVNFTDTSTDSDGTLKSRGWSFGDGGSSVSQAPSHAYASAGKFKIALTVTDDHGATSLIEQNLTLPLYSYDVVFKVTGVAVDTGSNVVLRVDVGDDGTWNHQYSYGDLSGGGVSISVVSGVDLRYEFKSSVNASDTGKRYSWVSTVGNGDFASAITQTGAVTIAGDSSITGEYGLQFYLRVLGGNDPSGEGWYNGDTNVTLRSDWVWGEVTGQSRFIITDWQLDGVDQNPVRSNIGALTTTMLKMNSAHTVKFVNTTQYYLTIAGGNNVVLGVTSPTGDQWYDSGTSTTVASDWIWDKVPGQSRYSVTNYAVDGVNQSPTRQYAGTLTTSPIIMSSHHTVAFASTTQYKLAFTVKNVESGTITSPSPSPQWVDAESSKVSASPNSGYTFLSWIASPAESVTFSDSGSATTTMTVNGVATVSAVFRKIIFTDDFESGWKSQWAHNNYASIKSYQLLKSGVELSTYYGNFGSIMLQVSTADCTSIQLSYRRMLHLEGGSQDLDQLVVQWRVGTSGSWTWLETVSSNTDWSQDTLIIPGADNKAIIQINFTLNICENQDYGYIDDVLVTGTS